MKKRFLAIKEEIVFWFSFLADKKFAFDFKIANLIMRDELRNILAADLITIHNIERLNEVSKDARVSMLIDKKLKQLADDIRCVMSGVD